MNTCSTLNKKSNLAVSFTKRSSTENLFHILLTVLFLIAALAFPATVRNSVITALNMCTLTLIPSLFPFMVAGELFFALGGHKPFSKILGKPFEKIFGISGAGVGAFILGAVCGLPLGAKYALTLYKNGSVSKRECELLMGMSNNAGMGFVVMGIGYSLWGSAAFGWLLYGCQIFAAILSAVIVSKGTKEDKSIAIIAPATAQTEGSGGFQIFAEAVSSCTLNMLKLCGFVVVFAAISAFIKQACLALRLPPLFFVTLSAFTEISFAASEAHSFFMNGAPSAIHGAKILTFFATGFAGMSAHMQTASFALKEGIKMRKYYTVKLLCGLICATTGAIVLHYFSF